MPDCDGAGTAERSYPISEVRGGSRDEIPHALKPEARGGSQEELSHSPTQEARGSGQEDQPHAEAARAQEGMPATLPCDLR